MEINAKNLNIETGASVLLLNDADAMKFNVHAGDRIEVSRGRNKAIAIVNISSMVNPGTAGLTNELAKEIDGKDGYIIDIEPAEQPKSLMAIKEKLSGRHLEYEEIYEIIKDIVGKKLDKNEITAFVVGLHAFGLDLDEAEYMSLSMIKTGETLSFGKGRIYDKHSIGGIPGDKTTLLVVPIVASAGLTIPKTSSRAITSAAGTADRAEVLMPVSLTLSEMKKAVAKTNGCIVWGGSIHLAPADDIFIKIEYPFSIDPLLLPSIMSKKKSVGSTDMVLDVPIGEESKIKNVDEAKTLIKDFSMLGNRLGIRLQGAITYGVQPIGYAIGAAAEAREALSVLEGKSTAEDLVDKATSIAGMLLEMSGKKNGKQLALEILRSGKAEKKLREIIGEQGGDPNIKASSIHIGKYSHTFFSKISGRVFHMDNTALAYAVRVAGAPLDKEAAIILNKKLNDPVKKGEALFTLYARTAPLLKDAEAYIEHANPVLVSAGSSMLIERISSAKVPSMLMFER
ncbi:MAG: AMP phosphorylase [Candidatus Micrarchaeaceae archaeon]